MAPVFFRRWTLLFWLILAGVAGVIWSMRCESVITDGAYYVTTGFEDISIFNLSRIRHGEPAYVDCFEYPYRMSLFNWLFYAVYGSAARIVDPTEANLPLLLRSITLAWAIGGMLAFIQFVRRCPLPVDQGERQNYLWIIPLAVVVWFGPTLGWWTMTARPDVPAIVCAFLGLTVVLRADAPLSWRQALTAGGLFFLAWGFKQSAVFMLAGTLLALLLRREWVGLLGIGTTFAALAAIVLLLAPPAYFTNLFTAPALAPLEFRQLKVILFWCGVTWMPLLLIGLDLLFVLDRQRRAALLRSRSVAILGIVFAVTLVWGLFAARRPGSSTNYFFEAWIAGMILVGLCQRCAVEGKADFASTSQRLVFGVFSLSLLSFSLLCVPPIFQPLHKPEGAPLELMVRLPREPIAEELLQAVRTSPRPIYVEDVFLVRLALGRDAGVVPVTDHTIYWDARKAGRLEEPDIVERIERHSYANLWLCTQQSFLDKIARDAGYVEVRDYGFVRQYARPREERRP